MIIVTGAFVDAVICSIDGVGKTAKLSGSVVGLAFYAVSPETHPCDL